MWYKSVGLLILLLACYEPPPQAVWQDTGCRLKTVYRTAWTGTRTYSIDESQEITQYQNSVGFFFGSPTRKEKYPIYATLQINEIGSIFGCSKETTKKLLGGLK